MANRLYYERYNNIYRFMDTIQSRPSNGQFGSSSQDKDDWNGTKTWEEAIDQFSNGIPERAEKLKKSLQAFKVNSNVSATKSRPKNYYHGYSPNVPNAIIGLPKSMRRIERTPQKIKAVSILYDMTANAGTSASTLQKAGEVVLQLVYLLEVHGYRVALEVIPYNAESSSRDFVLLINLKDWKHNLDILKLSFPLTSPAMFRRFGFKWAETLPDVTSRVPGYGRHIDKTDFEKRVIPRIGIDTKASYFIDVSDCSGADYDAIKLAKNLKISL